MQESTLSSLILAALAGTVLLGSCGVIGSDNSQRNDTYFRARLNGDERWSVKTVEVNISQHAGSDWFSVSGDTIHSEHGYYTEILSFIVIFRGIGTYSLVEEDHEWDETGAFYYENDGDVLISSYHTTRDTSANRLTITSYDSTTGIMKGTFRTTVVVDSAERESEPGEPPRRRPDTLRFTDGEFRVKIEDRRDE